MRQILPDQSISTTWTSPRLPLYPGGRPWTIMLWQFEIASGSGTNYLKIDAQQVANWEADSSTEVTFNIDDARRWQGPRIVSDAMITAASGSKYKESHVFRSAWDLVQLVFTFSGGGTRVFKVNVWAD